MKKKAAILVTFIIVIILLVLSLIIYIVVVGRFPFIPTIDETACHQSILQRATARVGPLVVGPRVIPLQCKTEKICITSSGQPCSDLPAKTKDNPITTAKVSYGENAKVKALDTIAESMYKCHDMLGRGLLNFVPDSVSTKNYCLICSRVAFDNEIKQSAQDITYGELYRYLQQKKTPDGQSYLNFIYGWNDWSISRTYFEQIKQKSTYNPNLPQNYDEWKLDLNRESGYVIIAQMLTKGRENAIAAATAGIILVPFTGGTSAIIAGGIIFLAVTPGVNYKYVPPAIIPYDIPTLKNLECTSFETAPS